MIAVLALIAATATTTPSLPDLAQPAPAADAGVTVVYLGCNVHETALSDCQIVNHDPVEPGTAAAALRLATGMSVPQALADRMGGHIVVKLNVKQQ